MPYFEDIKIGTRRELGSFTFTAENIKAFAEQFDPQPIHLDEEAARRSGFTALPASGWHVAAVCMKLLVARMLDRAAQDDSRGKPRIPSGPSPGFRDLQWPRPVLVGDTLTYQAEVATARTLASRPEWGLTESHNTAVNQRGELTFSFFASGFMARRPTS